MVKICFYTSFSMILNKLTKHGTLILILSIVLSLPMLAWGATTPSLGAAETYGVLSSTYTNTTTTTINGDVGFTTPPAVAPLGTHPYYGSSVPYSTAGTDQWVALGSLNAQWCDFNFGVATDLSLLPQPLDPGVYCITAATSLGNAWITLSGAGTYIFRITGALNTDANAVVSLTNGASACDIFWTPSAATTLGADTTFKGTVIGDSGITVGANTVWDGRALSFGGTVTTDTTTINNICGATPASLQIIKLVDNTNGWSAISSDFSISVLLSGNHVLWSPASGNAILWTTYALYADTYVISEDLSGLYNATFIWDCSSSGTVVLLPGDNKTCTITNRFIPIWWGRSTSIVIDACPDWDDSWNNFDWICVTATATGSNTPVVTIPVSWDNSPITNVEPKNYSIEPFVFSLTPTANQSVPWGVILPSQLPNSWANPDNNKSWKIIALVSVFWFMFTVYGIKLKKRLQ